MTEPTAGPTSQSWRRPSNPAWDLFKQRFYVNCWIYNDTAPVPIEVALSHYLAPLKEMAEVEYWGENDIILVNYFVHTFYSLDRAHQKDRSVGYLKVHDSAIHFHTGLITTHMEPIYAYFPMNKGAGSKGTPENPQYFVNFARPSDHFLLGIHMALRCYPLPVRCRYFDDYTHLIMDGTKRPDVNWTHIVDANWERVCEVLYPDKDSNDVLFKNATHGEIIIKLRGALDMALERVQANYRTAVPQFYKSELQLLLPLCLRDPKVPDLVLTIARKPYVPPVDGKFTYVAATILTIDMAYQNARLVARPEKDWLMAPETVYDYDSDVDND